MPPTRGRTVRPRPVGLALQGGGSHGAYAWGILDGFLEDGRLEFEGNTILLSNIGKIGDINLKVTPDTSAHDGRFDVTVISSRSLWDLVVVLFRMLTWRYRPTPRLHHFQAGSVVITTEPPVAVQIDGEDLGQTPLAAEVIPGGVHLVVGPRYRENPDGGGFLKEFALPWTAPRRARRWLPRGRYSRGRGAVP